MGLNLDLIDLAIFNFIVDFHPSPKCVKKDIAGKVYFWISHTKIMDELPLLGITSKRAVINRINKLCDAGLISRYEHYLSEQNSLYTAGERYDEYFSLPVNENSQHCERKFTAPVNENSHNNTIIDNTVYNVDTNVSTTCVNISTINKNKTRAQKKSLDDRKTEFQQKLTPFLGEYHRDLMNEFYAYWTEMNDGGMKMRFEMQKVFDVKRRLATWKKRSEGNRFISRQTTPAPNSILSRIHRCDFTGED